MVLLYYTHIDRRDYKTAHSMVSTDTSITGYCHFVNGFAQTEYDDVKLNGTPQAINGGYNVPIIITATEETPSGTWQTTYQGYQSVIPVNNGWMINGGELNITRRVPVGDPTPNPDATQEGQAIMQQFYGDLNKRDYPAGLQTMGNRTAKHHRLLHLRHRLCANTVQQLFLWHHCPAKRWRRARSHDY